MADENKMSPLSYRIAGWYGMLFSVCFLIYGGVKIVLSILDRNYSDLGNPILFTIVGLVLISVAIAYRDSRMWGWYGLIVVNALVIVAAIVAYTHYIDIILLALSAAALVFLLVRPTRGYLLNRR
jgi:hypothetical protein